MIELVLTRYMIKRLLRAISTHPSSSLFSICVNERRGEEGIGDKRVVREFVPDHQVSRPFLYFRRVRRERKQEKKRENKESSSRVYKGRGETEMPRISGIPSNK